jgi:hypothetical protein
MEPLRPGDPERIGQYRLLGRLGAGGMGQVFIGESRGRRRVAVKLLLNEYAGDRHFRERFEREAEAARKVGGSHTAQVVDADPAADPPWLVTAYIPGPSLADAVQGSGSLGPAAVAVLGAALSEGLAAIHACGLIHRDLKPGNIILADDGPRIIDFGVARSAEASAGLTGTGNLGGTVTFMSPEQIRGEKVSARSDIFALGSVLAYAANGRGPFDADTMPGVMYRIMSQDPDLGGLAEPLRGIVRACLAKAPRERPALEDVTAGLASQDQIQDLPATERPMASLPLSAPATWGGSISGGGLTGGAGGGGTGVPHLQTVVAGAKSSAAKSWGATFTAAPGSPARTAMSLVPALTVPAPTVPGPAAPESLTADSTARGSKARGAKIRGSKIRGSKVLAVGMPGKPARWKKRLLLAGLGIVVVAAVAAAGMYFEGFFSQPALTTASPETASVSSGASTSTGSASDATLPGRYTGTWTGTLGNGSGPTPEVTLTGGTVGTNVGNDTYTSADCVTSERLLAVTSGEVIIEEIPDQGRCGPAAARYVSLSPNASGMAASLYYSYPAPGSTPAFTGELTHPN